MAKPNPGPMMKKQEILSALLERWQPQQTVESVPYDKAQGRVLAEDLYARHSIPVVRSSRMDGIAIHYDTYLAAGKDVSGWRLGREFVRADTGDDFPDNYDTVIAIEQVKIGPDGSLSLNPELTVEQGMNISPCGSNMKAGTLLLEKGRVLRPSDLAAIVTGGHSRIPVVRRPKVAFLPTGSELVPIGTPLERGKNINSNALLAQLMLEEMGAEPVIFPITVDNREQLAREMEEALECADIVLINGGSSKGSEDFNTALLHKGDFITHGVAAVPGRPLSAAVLGGKAVINIPGPALAAYYCLDWCVRPLVCRYLGIPLPERRRVKAALTQELRTPPVMEMLVRINVERTAEGYTATPVNGRKDGIAAALTSNGQYISRIGQSLHPAGTEIEVELL